MSLRSVPITYEPMAPPSALASFAELWTPFELMCAAPGWLSVPRRQASPPRTVVLAPGFGTTEAAMSALRAHLVQVGHDVHGWGLGWNHGRLGELVAGFSKRVAALAEAAGEPVVAVGWSLGGYVAREVARLHPERFHRVVTMGSPIVGGPKYTSTAFWYRQRGVDLDAIERHVASRYDTPLEVPVSVIYTKRDGVVAWEACVDRWSPDVSHFEVDHTHFGLPWAPDVAAIVAREVER